MVLNQVMKNNGLASMPHNQPRETECDPPPLSMGECAYGSGWGAHERQRQQR